MFFFETRCRPKTKHLKLAKGSFVEQYLAVSCR